MSADGGLRKRRQHYFVQVPRETIRDSRLSYRARGLLAYLLDMPEGWDVRSESLAAAGTEGRDAVRKALRELAEHGYYRIERRRMLNAQFTMGTAVSEAPVPEWAEQSAAFGNKPVLCVQQADGSYLVKMPDGTLTSDGFVPEEAPQEAPEAGVDVADAAPQTPRADAHRPKTGFQASENPAPGEPAAGAPSFGASGASREREKGDREGRSSAAASASSARRRTTTAIPKGEQPSEAAGESPTQVANRVARDFISWIEAERGRPVQNRGRNVVALAKEYVVPAMETGATENQVRHALANLKTPWPSKREWDAEIVKVCGGRDLRAGRRPGQPAPFRNGDASDTEDWSKHMGLG